MAYIGVSPSNGVRQKHTYTASAGQTSFSGVGSENISLSYKDSNYVDVYRNGVKLSEADYTSTSGTAIVLPSPGASENDMIEVVVYDVFSAADTVSKADGGQFDGNVTMAGTLAVTGAFSVGSDSTITGGSRLTISNIADVNNDGIRLDDSTTDRFNNLTQDSSGNFAIQHFNGSAWNNNLTLSTSGALAVTGAVTANAGVVVDNITIDGTEIDLSSGDLTLDVASDIILDSDAANWRFKDDGTSILEIGAGGTGGGPSLYSAISDADMVFKGNDGGSTITALTLDMSEGGRATFNDNINLADTKKLVLGASDDLQLYHDGSNSYIYEGGTGFLVVATNGDGILFQNENGTENLAKFLRNGAVELHHDNSKKIETTSTGVTITGDIANASGSLTIDSASQMILDAAGGNHQLLMDGTEYGRFFVSSGDFYIYNPTSDKDIIFYGNDGGSNFTALSLDMSEAGRASFNTHVDMAGILVYSFIGSGGIACQQTPSANHSYIALNMRNSSGTQIGHIGVSTTAAAYNTGSDYRLKENINYSFDATSRLKQLKPARFNFIEDADNIVDGFIAHEVSSIVPEAITGEKDATEDLKNVILKADGSFLTDNISEKNWTKGKLSTTDNDGNTVDPIYADDTTWVASKTVPKYQQIDQSKLVPLLVKTIQELEARITALESK